MFKKITCLLLISLQFFFANPSLIASGISLRTQELEKISFLETRELENDLLSQNQQSENVMCDLSAALKVTDYSSTWECISGIPTTAPCSEVTTSYNYYSYTTFAWAGVTCDNGNVTEISLEGHSLTGSISSSIGLLTTLTHFSLGTNSITGSIPSSFGYLISLTYLNLGTNSITGTVPSQLGRLTNLVDLYLDTNQLTGSVPSELCGIASLSNFYLHDVSTACYASCLSSLSGKDFGSLASCTDTPTSAPSTFPTQLTSLPTVVPTAMPSTIPSIAPTTIPSVAPTTIPSVAPTTIPSVAPSTIPPVAPSSRVPTTAPFSAPVMVGCPITVRLYDKYGDGWNGAYLLATNTDYMNGYGEVTRNDSSFSTGSGFAPAADQYMATLSLIIGSGETSTLSIKSSTTIKSIKEWWEIQWSYSLRGKTYRGGVDTVMSLSCTWKSPSEYSITVINTKKILPTDTCKSCIKGSSASIEKTKLNPRNLLGFPRVSPTPVVPSYGQLPISLYTEDGSLYYSISDSNRVKLFAGESFCDLSREETCQESLGEGQYILRVSGSGGSSDANGNAWKFCGLKGGVPSEVFFRWKQGKCTVLQIVSDRVSSDVSYSSNDNDKDSLLPLVSAVSTLTSGWGLALLVGVTVTGAVIIVGFLGLRSYSTSTTPEGIDNSSRSTIGLFTYSCHSDRNILDDPSVSTGRDIEK